MTPLKEEQCIKRYTYDNFPLEQSPLRWRGIDGRIARHMTWLNREEESGHTIGSGLLKVFEYTTLKTLLRGSPVEEGYKRYIDSLKTYKIFMANKGGWNPPPFEEVIEKRADRTFTHTHYFAIHEEVIWAKARYIQQSQWEPIYFDGMIEGRIPRVVLADGCNLIVMDHWNDIHYKKVIREVRDGDKLQFIDKTIKDNWKPNWYTLPYVSSLFNLFTPKRLFISAEIKSFSISHLGRYGRYYEDGAGVQHDVTTITTLFALFVGSKKIHFADAWWSGGFNHPSTWLGLGFDHTIPGPDDPDFEADIIDASGSTMVLTGIVDGKPRYYTALADVDTLGRNSLCAYTLNKEDAIPNKVRFMTPAVWERQPDLPHGFTAMGAAQIYQCGEGNLSRTLQIPVRDPQGSEGILTKNIADQDWHFVLLHSMPNK